MAVWPTLADVKEALGITGASSDVALSRALAAAIESVNTDRGVLVEEPELGVGPVIDLGAEPDSEMRAQAALLLAVRGSKLVDAPFGVAAVFDAGALYVSRSQPDYQRLMKGGRVSWGVG